MKQRTRREFMKETVLGALGSSLALTAVSFEDLVAEPQRGYTAGKYAIELDGVPAGWLYSAEGGHATSDVIEGGGSRPVKKHIAGVKYEDIVLTCGTGMSKGFYEWIVACAERRYMRKNGAIVACDYNYKEMSRLEFENALITEFALPALDAASKDAAKMSIKISPELTREKTSRGGTLLSAKNAMQKKWVPSNFRLKIDRLDCSRVNKIDAITIKQQAGGNPGYLKGSGPPQNATLVITLPEAQSKPFYEWHQASLNRRNAAGEKRTGQLDYLSEEMRELISLRFDDLGIKDVTPERPERGIENIRRVKAEMYYERMQLIFAGA
jgi:phage tail-like protein